MNVESIPLKHLNCHHCKLWQHECTGIPYRDLEKTGGTYCAEIFGNYSEESVDGLECDWINGHIIPKKE